MSMKPVNVSQIRKSFGEIQAVSDVSFAVQPGEIFGLLGPNGAGKTTTIRIILDIFKPDRGTVSYTRMCRWSDVCSIWHH